VGCVVVLLARPRGDISMTDAVDGYPPLHATPWGKADSVVIIAPGIASYSTPSHGGLWLSAERVAGMPRVLREHQTFTVWCSRSGGQWYEEDCDWAIVALAYPAYFTQAEIDAAHGMLKVWQPGLYETFVRGERQ
jgi:hypothetical protein